MAWDEDEARSERNYDSDRREARDRRLEAKGDELREAGPRIEGDVIEDLEEVFRGLSAIPRQDISDVDAEVFHFRVKDAPCTYWHSGEHIVRPSEKKLGEWICQCGERYLLCRVEE